MDSHPMSWTPDDLVNAQNSVGPAQHVTQIDEQGTVEVENALKTFKGRYPPSFGGFGQAANSKQSSGSTQAP